MAALEQFSQNGYAGTNIRELTASLGLAKSSMYRHFSSKEEIWNALLDEMIAYYAARFGSPEHLPPVPASPEELVGMTMRLAELTIRDEKNYYENRYFRRKLQPHPRWTYQSGTSVAAIGATGRGVADGVAAKPAEAGQYRFA